MSPIRFEGSSNCQTQKDTTLSVRDSKTQTRLAIMCGPTQQQPPFTMTDVQRPTILVTGGCGYIGSHTIVCLLEKNFNVVVVDNLSNSSPVSLQRVAQIVGLTEAESKERLVFHQVDLCNEAALRKVFEASPTFQACIHFAGLKVRSLYKVRLGR